MICSWCLHQMVKAMKMFLYYFAHFRQRTTLRAIVAHSEEQDYPIYHKFDHHTDDLVLLFFFFLCPIFQAHLQQKYP